MPKKPLVINVEFPAHAPNTAVVYLSGSAGMNEEDLLKGKLSEVAQHKTPVIILELTGLDFISSLGLGAIIHCHLRSRHHQGHIRLVNPQPKVLELLETTRLNKIFPIYGDLKRAMEA